MNLKISAIRNHVRSEQAQTNTFTDQGVSMSRTSHRLGLVAATGAGIAVAFTFSMATAQAGHLNTVLRTDLSGRQEIGAGATDKGIVGDPNGRGEAYVFGIDGDPTTLCYILTADKIGSDLVGAHIHFGAAGANGPIVANLASPVGGDAADCLTEGETGKGMEPGIVGKILANPSAYYVNVHTAAFPSGAIRGQLSALHD